ncbi:YraN family protein [uncultured Algimonas sp.]|uniref:YraN family protein n=1 Tax=uncultured Algimonas sp. TaxID=1547920 RepID=UPI0026103C89|nr:YraN family protein [uncultured Algimonas sp.]
MSNGRQAAERAGRRAEIWVAAYLRLTGYRILAQRYRTRSGEIDLVARRRRRIVFVEVKQRANADHAVDPVTARSEERIIRAAEIFLSRHPAYVEQGYGLRYDLVTVLGRWRIRHQKDAFRGW